MATAAAAALGRAVPDARPLSVRAVKLSLPAVLLAAPLARRPGLTGAVLLRRDAAGLAGGGPLRRAAGLAGSGPLTCAAGLAGTRPLLLPPKLRCGVASLAAGLEAFMGLPLAAGAVRCGLAAGAVLSSAAPLASSTASDRAVPPVPGRGMRLPGAEAELRCTCVAELARPAGLGRGLGPALRAPGLRVAPQVGFCGDSGSSFLGGGLDSMATLQAAAGWVQRTAGCVGGAGCAGQAAGS